MKRILLPNAQLAWIQAIRYADYLAKGIVSLQTKKDFVSALHNSVELFAKQWLLDNCDYKVIEAKNVTQTNIELYNRFFASQDLNEFFCKLSTDERKHFFTVEFSKLKETVKDIIKPAELGDAFSELAALRNDETHFYIDPDTYLSDSQFVTLYNFMIDFYQGIKEKELIPNYWGECFDDEQKKLLFDRQRLQKSFSFRSILAGSPVAKEIKLKLETVPYLTEDFDDNPMKFATYLIKELNFNMDVDCETLSQYIEAMNRYGIIEYSYDIDEIPNFIPSDDESGILIIDTDNKHPVVVGFNITVHTKKDKV